MEKNNKDSLQEKLAYEDKFVWDELTDSQKTEVDTLCAEYIEFLNSAKTERETVNYFVNLAVQNGFRNIESINGKLKAGDKVYFQNRNKNLFTAVIGEQSIEMGINSVGAHIDSPRIDLKQNPLYEEDGLALFKTHYYGGIKKYQWLAVPLAAHGVLFREDGSKLEFVIGEDEKEPVFCITDLLPHLAKNQMEKKMTDAIEGEDLNILVGSYPLQNSEAKQRVKLNILDILNKKYGIKERDFTTAEIEMVPAFKAKEVGFDRSLIGGYGQDDRVCSFMAFKAMLSIDTPKKTAVCVFADKEEIGSVGNTGMQSKLFEDFIAELLEATGQYDGLKLRRALRNSKMLSADVDGAVDPNYPQVSEKQNASFLGKGVTIVKYTGSKGKVEANDAHPEFLSEIRQLFDKEKIIWQTGELGKVDMGGGGTIAQYLSNLGMDVVDCATPLLSMHSPFEISSKVDVYMSYRAYNVFLKA